MTAVRWVGYLVSAAGLCLLVALFFVLRPTPDAGPVAPVEPALAPPPVERALGSQPEAAVPEVVQEVPLVRIAGGHREAGPALLQVRQGDRVRLRLLSDAAQEVHLHGYDLQLQLLPGEEAELDFVANLSGRFEYELHGHHAGSHAALGVIEVYPQ